jgi:hypothetical protein
MKYFRVKYGYGKDEFLSIDENEYRKAVIAQGSGSVAIFASGTVSGNNILAIMPDYQRVLGLRRDWELGGEDYALLGEKTQQEYQLFMKNPNAQNVPALQKPNPFPTAAAALAEKMRIERGGK